MRRISFAVGLLLVGATAPALADDLADSVLQRLAQVTSRHATFREEKHLASLTTVLRSSGTLAYAQPAYLEKITIEPKPERLVINGASLSITEGNAAARTFDIESHPALRALVDTIRAPLDGDVETLRRSYTIKAQGDLGAWRLTLLPSHPALARFVRSVMLDGANNGLRTIRIEQPNGDVQTTTIDPVP